MKQGRLREGAWAAAVLLAPVTLVLVLVHRHAVNVPLWDEWHWAVRSYAHDHLARGELGELWRLHNGHRVFFPRLIGAALADATSLDLRPAIYLATVFPVGIYVALWKMQRAGSSALATAVLAVPFALMQFSLAGWPRWTDCRTMHIHLALLCAVGSLAVLTCAAPGVGAVALAGALAWVATGSHGVGVVLWPVLAAAMWVLGYRRRAHLVLWGALALSCLVPYAVDLARMPGGGPVIGGAPGSLATFTCAVLGRPFSVRIGPAAVAGALGLVAVGSLALAAARATEDGMRRACPWVALALVALGTVVLAALTRVASFGVDVARAVRYVPHANLFWIAGIGLAGMAWTDVADPAVRPRWGARARVGRQVLAGCFLVGVAIGFARESHSLLTAPGRLAGPLEKRARGRECLRAYETADPECLAALFGRVDLLRARMRDLEGREVAFLDEPG